MDTTDFCAYSDDFNARLLSGEASWEEIGHYIGEAQRVLSALLEPINEARAEIVTIIQG